jgi:anti-anti-sigma factor
MPFIEFDSINQWLVGRFRVTRLTDPATITAVGSDLQARVNKLPVLGRICLSFAGVEYVSSGIIGMLLAVKADVELRLGQLVLCDLGEPVLNVLKVTGLERVFKIEPSEADVLGRKKKITAGRTWGDGVDWVD